MSEDTQAFYSGFEPVDVGDMSEVREIRTTIPATKGVRVKIVKADNLINASNTYRQINLQLKIVNGIDETGKYKGKVVFGKVCYYADPTVYTKDFFKARQHLVQLKYLLKATGIANTTIDGHILEQLVEAPEIKVDITVKKRKVTVDDGVGGTETIEQLDNEVRNYKAIPVEEQV